MKSLFECILEARERLTQLPFSLEQFKQFVIACDDYNEDDPEYQNIQKIVTKEYGERVWRGLLGWVEGTQWQSDPQDLYNILCWLPKDRIGRVLGAGSYGSVIDMGDKVCKLFHKNTPMEANDRKFYEYCMTHNCKQFPIVYKIGKHYVIMEKLQTNTNRCKEYNDWVGWSPKNFVPISLPETDTQDGKTTIEDCCKYYLDHKKDIDKAIKQLPKIGQEVFEWALEVWNNIRKAVPGANSFMDMRLANIGERKNKEIVWFDI